MPTISTIGTRDRIAITAVALLGVLAVAQYWFDNRRPVAAATRFSNEITVTSAADRGEGSLREAIFAANAAQGRVRIRFRTPQVILRDPLPPLVNPLGIVLEAAPGGTEIDAAAVKTGPGLEIGGDNSVLQGFAIVNAQMQGILAKGRYLRISGVRLADGGEGIHVTDSATGLIIEKSVFERNRIGVVFDAARAGMLHDNRFTGQTNAGIWAVRAAGAAREDARPLSITGNRFDGDRVAIVVGNVSVIIEKNEMSGARDTAVYVIGQGVQVRNNQVRDSVGIGILIHTAPGTLVEGNEISRNRTLGMLVRASGGSTLQKNRVYNNGYGMALVLGEVRNPVLVRDNAILNQQYDGIVMIGDSPAIRSNQVIGNGRAGLSVLDFVSRRAGRIRSQPFLEGNTLTGNAINEAKRGDYRSTEDEGAK